MAIVINNTVPTSGSGTLLTRTPGGPYDLLIVNNAGATVYLGTAATVTSTNGCPLPSGGVLHMTGVAAGGAAALYVVLASGGTTTSVGYVLTTSV